jgi:hypothetical protein
MNSFTSRRRSGRSRRLPWRATRAATLVLLAGTLAAACGTSSASSGNRTRPTTVAVPTRSQGSSTSSNPGATTSTTSTTATTSLPTPPVLLRGAEGASSRIPWKEVGPGWSLALWSPDAGTGMTTAESLTLFLVDPLGGRYSVGVFSDAGDLQIADWSGDLRRVLLTSSSDSSNPSTTVTEVDLVTGATLDHFTISDLDSVSFTRPDGLALLVAKGEYPQAPSLSRVGADGSPELTYPDKFPVVGAGTGTAIYSPDGTELVLGTQGGLALVGNNGALLGELPVPTVNGGCSVIRWWRPGVAVASCATSDESGKVQFWLVPVSGAAPTLLASDPDGYRAIWQIPSGTYTQLAACGVILIAKLSPNGTWSTVIVPGVVDNMSETIVGTDGDALEVEATASCASGRNPPGPSLMWFDAAADTTSVILGPPLNGGAVVGAISYPDGSN